MTQSWKKHVLAWSGIIAAFLLTLFFCFEMKKPCLTQSWAAPARLQYRSLCYNDVQALYGVRKLNVRAIPYVEEKSYEYPVIMAFTMWGASLLAQNHAQFFRVTVPILAFFAALALLGLSGAVGRRRELYWFAAGTPLLFYAFLNWDLIPVAFVCLAIWAWKKENFNLAGAWLGFGIAAKVYPAFFLPALMVGLWNSETKEARLKSVIKLAAFTTGTWALINLPVLLAEYLKTGAIEGWISVFTFHAKRSPDTGTIWHWIRMGLEASGYGVDFHSFKAFVDRFSALAFVATSAALLWNQFRNKRDPWMTGFATLAFYLVVSKIHSPQHALWMVPALVVCEIPPSIAAAYFLSDALVFVGGFEWLADSDFQFYSAWTWVFVAGVIGRAVSLGAITACGFAGKRDRAKPETAARTEESRQSSLAA